MDRAAPAALADVSGAGGEVAARRVDAPGSQPLAAVLRDHGGHARAVSLRTAGAKFLNHVRTEVGFVRDLPDREIG